MKNVLPIGWTEANLEDVSSICTGKLDANAADTNGKYPFFTCGEEILQINTPAFDTEAVLLAGNGNFGVKWYRGKFNAYQRTYVIEPRGISGQYLYHLVQWNISRITKGARGSTIKYLRLGDIAESSAPIAPRHEQDRIVSKIDELFSQIEEGERALARVQQLVERYRQSVLKAAVTGELTRDWREKNKHQLESGDALLKRILAARRAAWEKAEWEKMRAKGTTPANDNWKQKYPEPSPPDTTDLPELPEGWVWACGAQLFEWSSGDFLPAKAMLPGDFPVYGGNGINGHHSSWNVDFRTLVIGRVGVHCGNVHLSAAKSWITDNAIYATYLPAHCSTEFLASCLQSARLGNLAQGGAQPFVNQKALNEAPIPLPPILEQSKIVDLLATESSRLDSIVMVSLSETQRAAALKQGILKHAFSGNLVPQEPNDEPASVLLERIAGERAADASDPPKRRRKKEAA